MKRKGLILTLLISILVPLFVGCGPSKEEKILYGKWEGMTTERDQDGDEVTYRVVMDFKKDLMKMTIALGESGIGEYGEMTVSGDWMASEDEITFFADEDSARITFTPQAKNAADLLGISLSDFEDLLTANLKSEFGISEDIKMYSLSDNSVTIDFDGSRLTLYRKSN